MPRTFEVQTGARLHFGPLASGAVTGRRFGGIGMMVASPGVVLTATESDVENFRGGSLADHERIQRVCRTLSGDSGPPPVLDWQLSSAHQAHSGFGTGTQLSLAAASIWVRQQTGAWPTARSIAPRLGRGARSAIGIHGFDVGGFLVDAGQAGDDSIGELAVRVEFPAEWRVLIVRRRESEAGLSGSAELAAFEKLAPMSSSLTDRLCRIVLMGLLPSLQGRNCEEFTRALAQYGHEVGQYFAPVQGGVFADPAVRELPQFWSARLVQSSWGPTVVTFADSPEAAAATLVKLLNELGDGWSCDIVTPRNEGASRVSVPAADG
jgi:beta-ribofuranosylaminobenzene 5'-phosphate synthase